jgi:16S rRNA (cytosine1402-N4)-methyltransferase
MINNNTTGMTNAYHTTVMLKEAVDGIVTHADGVYVDCTFGGGGHSREILGRLSAKGRLIAFDQDEAAKNNLPEDDRLIFVPHNFRHLQRFLRLYAMEKVDGILADLGVSSHQFNVAERGFSIRYDAALDMRMDKRATLTAADILKNYPEEKLHKLFEQYGEVTNSKSLAKAIVAQRSLKDIATISQFKDAVYGLVKGNPNKYFDQVFQALRIEVNDEFWALKELLEQSVAMLNQQGRIAVISFHSLEDRLVKSFFKNGSFEEQEDNIFGIKKTNPLKIITKKPQAPTEYEIKNNPRSRSARLRIAEKK